MTGPLDFSSFFSEEANARVGSALRNSLKLVNDPDIVFLGGGLPMNQYFPWNEISASSPVPPFANGIGAVPTSKEEEVTTTIPKYNAQDQDIDLCKSLQYGATSGHKQIRDFVKEHTEKIHRPPYQDWDVSICTGNSQSFDSAIRTFCNRGDYVLIEEYSFPSSVGNLEATGVKSVPIPMDDHGIIPEKLEEILNDLKIKPKFLYTVPTGQNPTGSNLPFLRRQAVYQLARKFNFLIIEDDPYYFLQMAPYKKDELEEKLTGEDLVNDVIVSFLSMDLDGRVIRLDSTSKIFAPGARFGWITAQKHILEKFNELHEVNMVTISGFTQSFVNGLFQRWGQDGYLDWLCGLRHEYSIKRNACANAVDKYFPKEVSVFSPPTAGMFFIIRFDAKKHPKFDGDVSKIEDALFQESIKSGCLVIPGSAFAVKPFGSQKNESTEFFFRGTYAAVDLEKLDLGLKRFAEAVKVQFEIN